MRISLIFLCVSVSLLAINNLLQSFGDVRGFLGIPYPLGQYPFSICLVAYYASLLGFCSQIYVAVRRGGMNQTSIAKVDEQLSPGQVAGIAVSSLLSILFVFAIAAQEKNVLRAALVYFLFLLTCGLLIEPSPKSIWRTILYSIWPASFFLLFSLALLALVELIGSSFVISGGKGDVSRELMVRLGAVSVGMALFAIPTIAAASVGRRLVFDLVLSFSRASPEVLAQLKQNLSIALAMLALLATAILGLKVAD